ncbi:MAG TPA: hypothetical protein VIG44_11905 [Thermomicrobiales bacterium]
MHGFPVRRFSLAVVSLGLLLLALVPAAVGAASPYPPNTVVSTYYDARYCGGPVSIVSDSGGNLIDVCTTSGVRIDPAAAPYGVAGYPYGYAPGYGAAIIPTYQTGSALPAYGSIGNGTIIRQYNDGNANCPNGDVTETTSGFFCTANGQPAASSLSAPVFNGGFAPYTPAFNGTAYGTIANGSIIRQYNDGRSNCSNGDVTETTSGFFCTANGQPAFRTS